MAKHYCTFFRYPGHIMKNIWMRIGHSYTLEVVLAIKTSRTTYRTEILNEVPK